jgi:phospholipid/cholesterol/gamma-HCH transport system substrate-binding protein
VRTRATLVALLVVLLSAAGLAGCSGGGGQIHATATFDDVADLASGAPVMMSDITIGKVQSIKLDRTGRRAKVRFTVKRSAEVPADVVAKVRRTTPLGEKFIDLAPQTRSRKAPLLADGTTIRRTKVVSDLEQLVSSGTAAFSALSASQIAILLDEGAKSFGGRGPALRTVLDQLSQVADGYDTRTGQVKGIIDDLDQLAGDLAPKTDANGRAIANMNDTLAILNDNDKRFFALVRSLNRLADDGNRILDRHLRQIATQIRGLRDVSDAIADEQVALAGVLENLPRHNKTVPLAERSNFIHVLLDVIICGVPGGGDVPGDPVDSCRPTASQRGGS